jgi:hypothetical protein
MPEFATVPAVPKPGSDKGRAPVGESPSPAGGRAVRGDHRPPLIRPIPRSRTNFGDRRHFFLGTPAVTSDVASSNLGRIQRLFTRWYSRPLRLRLQYGVHRRRVPQFAPVVPLSVSDLHCQRTTNPIESTFATIRLRHRRTKGDGTRQASLVMMFKRAGAAAKHWRKLISPELILVLTEAQVFTDEAVQFTHEAGSKFLNTQLSTMPRPLPQYSLVSSDCC